MESSSRQQRDAAQLQGFFERSFEKTASSFDSMVSVAIFSGLSQLISLSVLVTNRYIPEDWFSGMPSPNYWTEGVGNTAGVGG